MDRDKFLTARSHVLEHMHIEKTGIGRLGEKTLHAILKRYAEGDEEKHEVRIGKHIADIYNDEGIMEVQTRDFNKMRAKLGAFLPEHKVTIIYPVAHIKYLSWLDPVTGEASKKRRSPKVMGPYAALLEMYKIKRLLLSGPLAFRIILLNMDEYRNLNGWDHNKKRGSSRFDRIPADIVDEIHITEPDDYIKLIPPGLGEHFTSKNYAKAAGMTVSAAQTALNVLNHVGAVIRAGKAGGAYIYEPAIPQDGDTDDE